MDFEKIFKFLDATVFAKSQRHLKDVEKFVLRGAWQGQTYDQMAAASDYRYTPSYLKQGVGPKLWKLLSQALGEEVNKTNFRAALERRAQLAAAQLNSCQACGTPLLLNGQLCELPQTDDPESKKVSNGSPDSPEEESQSSDQKPQPDNSDETKSDTFGLSTLMNFIKPGVPLLLSFVILSCLFALSWMASWCGVTNHLAGQLPKAQLGYNAALKLNPWSAAADYNQGATYEDQQNYQQAHTEYQKAIEGGLIEAYNNQARLDILEGKYDAAVCLLQIGLPLAKDDRVKYSMLKNRGWARLGQKRLELAKLDIQDAIKLRSERVPAYCLLAQVLEGEGDKKGALVEWGNCLGFSAQRISW